MRVELSDLPEISVPLPWQEQYWGRFNQQLDSRSLPHALLVAGPEHTGKAQLALALARRLLCAQPSGGLNCGQCHPCQLSASGSHGDLCWLQPEEKSRVIKIDQVRQAVSFANQTANFGTRKVVVLYPADTMNTNAANALLKALEEPAADTYLILACHRLHGLPATIRSRCQIVKLAAPTTADSLSWLDTVTGQREQSEQLLSLAQGRPLLAARLFREDSADVAAATRAALAGILCGRMGVPEAAALLGDIDAEAFLSQLQRELQHLLRSRGANTLRSREGRSAFILDHEITRLRSAVEAGANPNVQLLMEALLARCHRELGSALHSDSMNG